MFSFSNSRFVTVCGVWFWSILCCESGTNSYVTIKRRAVEQESTVAGQASGSGKQAFLVRVPLPIDHSAVQRITQAVQRIIDRAPPAVRPEDRPIAILQFDTDRGATGAGSSLSDCLDLARMLTSGDANRIKTVAYLPAVLDRFRDPQQRGIACQLVGHAVMVALAAEDLVIAEGGELGEATIDQPKLDPLTLDIYRNIASNRLTIPVSMAMSMVDPRETLFAVTTDKGDLIVNRDELDKLSREGKAIESETLAPGGRLARYTVAQLDRFSINVHAVADRQQLAVRYGINPSTLQSEVDGPKKWKAVQLDLPDYVDHRSVDWGMRAIEEALSKEKANLVIVVVDSRGGNLDSCMRMAKYLADFDPERVRTSVYIGKHACGPAALIPLSADHLIMSEASVLGGNYEPLLNQNDLRMLDDEFRRLATAKERDQVMFEAMLNPKIELSRWRHEQTGQVRMMTSAEQALMTDAATWKMLSPVDLSQGLTGKQAEQDGIARSLLATADELGTFYQLESPAKQLTPTKTDRMIERFARFLASPLMAGMLLFGAMFFLSTEMSTPGVGVPGILGTLCVVLFFWSQYLDGNADWLEVLLFVVGISFLLMELFVFPGTIILGVAGLLMVVISIVLASQTFLIPRNSQDLARLPVSLGIVCAAFSGGLVALVVLRKYLPNAPFFKRMMLEPPKSDRLFGDESKDEEFDVLVGQRGVAVSRLVPSGKARFGNKYVDVMTEGLIVDPKTKIEIIEVNGNRVLVRPVEKD